MTPGSTYVCRDCGEVFDYGDNGKVIQVDEGHYPAQCIRHLAELIAELREEINEGKTRT